MNITDEIYPGIVNGRVLGEELYQRLLSVCITHVRGLQQKCILNYFLLKDLSKL